MAEAFPTANLYHTIDVYPTLGTSHSFASLPSCGNLTVLGGTDDRRMSYSSSHGYTNNHPNNHHQHTNDGDRDNNTLNLPSYLRSRNSTRSLHSSYRDDESYYNSPLPNNNNTHHISDQCDSSSSHDTSPTASHDSTRRGSNQTLSPTLDSTQNNLNPPLWSPSSPLHGYVNSAHGSHVFPNSPRGTRYRTGSVGRAYSNGSMMGSSRGGSGRGICEDDVIEEGICGGGGVNEEEEEEVLVEVVATMLSQS